MTAPAEDRHYEPRSFLVTRDRPVRGRTVTDSETGWAWLGWFGLVLAVAGIGDLAITWWPLRFGSIEWEFGTLVATFSGLPLATMGLAAILGSVMARGVRWQVRTIGALLLVMGLVLAGAFAMFLTIMPIAFRSAPEGASIGITKAVAKTSVLAVVFVTAYLLAGALAFRRRRSR
jgi:hypothetical protein